jgi:hypothetical protein
MSVSNYKNNECRYNIDKLEKVVYLISEEASKNVYIDNGEAYISNMEEEPLALPVYNIALSDTDELDERYKFTHTLTFSMHGYANYRDFGGKYYAIVKTVDGAYWLVNPLFPCKVTYTYTLDGKDSHTDFTLSTISNHPTLRIHGMTQNTPQYECGYKYCKFDTLNLNESLYSLKRGNIVLYTNDGFKEVVFNKNSASFSEIFDGKNVQHQLNFNIKFDEYKDSWHYNLLEFVENRYAAIIKTTCGKYILCGYGFGLQPSFTVEANDDITMDNIQIQMIDMHDNGDFIRYEDSITIEKDGVTTWQYTNKYNGYECIGNNLARYLLMEEVDSLMNPIGNYKVLVGYENDFNFLNIVGTFTETITFNSYDCSDGCRIQTSFPLEFVFNSTICREYTVLGDSDWNIVSSENYITVSPSSGVAGQSYTVNVCNSMNPTDTEAVSYLTVNYCNRSKTYTVRIKKSDSCLYGGSVFDKSANGQYVVIPTSCCVKDVRDFSGTITNIVILNNYIRVYIPQNTTGEPRQFILEITYCDDTEGEAIINQGTGFERWVKEGTGCTGNQKCDIERKYTGTTAIDINTRTNETRNTNCKVSSDCTGIQTRWINTSETTCSGGKKYIIQAEQLSNDGGETWVNTGNKRLGSETSDPSGDCAGVEEFEDWRENGYVCDETTKYNRLQLYVSTDQINWIATNTYKRGDRVLETNSADCGYIIPSTGWTYEDWRLVETDYVCDDGNKYQKLRRWVSNDQVSSKAEVTNWTPTDVYKKGGLLEENSTDCGYDPSISGNCSEYRDEGDTICDGFDKYKYLRKYVRECEDCNNCTTEWQETQIFKRGDKIQEHSLDCGYIPSDNYYEWREDGWDCNGYDKYQKYRKYISENGNNWYATNIYKLGDSPIEVNSADCGYVPRIHYEYQWIESDVTRCVGTTKYYQYKKQRRVEGSQDPWEDVIPTVYSFDADGTMQPRVAEEDSPDCGYVPPIQPRYRWVTMDINKYWICGDCDDTPHELQKIEYRENDEEADIRFKNCDGNTTLTSSDYGNRDIVYAKIGSCVTTIGVDAFKGKTNLQQVMIPSTVDTIDDNAFSGCTSLVDFSVPMSVVSINDNAFRDCIQLNKIMLPNNLTTLGSYAFSGCKNFPSINIPQYITIIPTGCFYDCDGMTDIYLPENVRLIQSKAFGECGGLVNFTCYATEPPAIYSDTFSGMNEELKIYVPAASVNLYKAAWSAYANNIVAIGE